MSKTVQWKRGNANVNSTYTGAQGEITVNTDTWNLHVHDGVTAGGWVIDSANGGGSFSNVTVTGNITTANLTASGDVTGAYFIGNGSQLTGLPAGYTDSNVVTLLSSFGSNSISTSGNIAATNINGNVNKTTDFKITVGLSEWTFDETGVLTIPGEINTVGVITAGNVDATFFNGNGRYLTGIETGTNYSNSNVAAYLTTYSGNISAGNVLSDNYRYSNGSSAIPTLTSELTNDSDFITNSAFGNLVVGGPNNQFIMLNDTSFDMIGMIQRSNGSIDFRFSNITSNALTYLSVVNNADDNFSLVTNVNSIFSIQVGNSAITINDATGQMTFSPNSAGNIGYDFSATGEIDATAYYADADYPVGYSFTTPGSDTGLSHYYTTPGNTSSTSVLRLRHDSAVVAEFFDNLTTQLSGNLVVTQDGDTFGTFPDAYVQVYSNVDSYSQIVAQNINNGADASTDVVVTADNGNDSAYYINMGINGSNYAVDSWFGDTDTKNDGYLVVVGYSATGPSTGNTGNLILGSTNGKIKTFVGNIAEANVITVVDTGGLTVNGNISVQNIRTTEGTVHLGQSAGLTSQSANAVAVGTYAGQSTQGTGAIAIGREAGSSSQGVYSVAVGWLAGNASQGGYSVAIGPSAGSTTQGENAVAIGVSAARETQGTAAVAIGQGSGTINQGARGIAIGDQSGQQSQSANAVAIGTYAGYDGAGISSISIGTNAGYLSQGASAIAIGGRAGNVSQGSQSIAIGVVAGQSSQGTDAVAIGTSAGAQNQSEGAVAIGQSAGVIDQGLYAVAIGSGAGYQNQANNSIAITATGTQLSPEESGFYVDPVRNDVGNISEVVTYNTSTKEFTYADTLDLAGNVTAANIIVEQGIFSFASSPAAFIDGFDSASFTGNVTAGNLIATGNIVANVNGYSIGYRDIPQVTFTSNTTLALTDAGKHYYSANSANVITIPNNATVSFNIGTAISIVQQGTANLTVAPGSGVTLYLAGNSTAGSRTLGNYGMATLMKVAADTWFINGTGVV